MAKNQKNELIRIKRMNQILDMMGKGMYMHEIASTLSNEWNCSTRTVFTYAKKVREVISKELEKEAGHLLNKFYTLYREAMKVGDIKTANQILANIGKFSIGETVNHKGFDIKVEIIDANKPKGNSDIQ